MVKKCFIFYDFCEKCGLFFKQSRWLAILNGAHCHCPIDGACNTLSRRTEFVCSIRLVVHCIWRSLSKLPARPRTCRIDGVRAEVVGLLGAKVVLGVLWAFGYALSKPPPANDVHWRVHLGAPGMWLSFLPMKKLLVHWVGFRIPK